MAAAATRPVVPRPQVLRGLPTIWSKASDTARVIESWQDCKAYVYADLARYEGPYWRVLLQLPQTRWQVRLRLTEWWCNTHGGPVGAVLRWRLMAHGMKLGYSIAINRVGAGVRLPHVGFIAINGEATVGRNCQILPGVVLGGTQAGAPLVGDDVFLAQVRT